MKLEFTPVRRVLLWLGLLAGTCSPLTAQYSEDVFKLKRVSDLYDERGFRQNKAVTVDGKLVISNSNGNVSYVYPISHRTVNGYPLTVSLNYCGSVAFTAFRRRTEGVTETFGTMGTGYHQWQTYHQNRPAWLLGVNGFAVQAISTTTQFHSDWGKISDNSNAYHHYTDADLVWTIDGYDFCNRMLKFSIFGTNEQFYRDEIKILRDDGSLLQLSNIRLMDHNSIVHPEILYTGYYMPIEANNHGYGIVEVDTTNFPEYFRKSAGLFGNQAFFAGWTPRKLRYYPGDGLEYVFREWNVPYGTQVWTESSEVNNADHGRIMAGPTIFYLDQINSAAGRVTNIYRSRHYPMAATDLTMSGDFRDSTKGRALTLELTGHRFEYGSNWMTIEALGRTTKVWFNTVNRSGTAVSNEMMPLAENGYAGDASKAIADLPDNNTGQFKSFLGYVTKIVDPEGRTTDFTYQSYRREYYNYGFPHGFDGTNPDTIDLRNYRLKVINEPTVKYKLCYYYGGNPITNFADDADCDHSGEPVTEIHNPALYATSDHTESYAPNHSNMCSRVEKYDCSGLISTDTYEFHYLSLWKSQPFRCIVRSHDNLTDSVIATSYTYDWKTLHNQSIAWDSCRFTELVSVSDSSGGLIDETTTTYDSLAPNIVDWERRSHKVYYNGTYVNGGTPSIEVHGYVVSLGVHSFPGNDSLQKYFGSDITVDQIIRFQYRNGKDSVLSTTETKFLYLPRIDTVFFGMNHWDKIATKARYDTLVAMDSIPAGRFAEFAFDPRVAVYRERDSVNPVIYYYFSPDSMHMAVPPFDRLPISTVLLDRNSNIISGRATAFNKEYVVAGYAGIDTLPTRGRPIADTLIGQGGSTGIVTARYKYIDMYVGDRRLPGMTENANGARTEVRYRYVLNDSSSVGLVESGRVMPNNDSSYSTNLLSTEYFSHEFEVPLVERQFVRKYNTAGSLYIDTLARYFERTFYGQESGSTDYNGWYSRFEYDRNGRLRTAWLPFDFPSGVVDTLPLTGIQRWGMTAGSSAFVTNKSAICRTTGAYDSSDSLPYVTRYDDVSTLQTGRFVNGPPTCIACSEARQSKQPEIQSTCLDTYFRYPADVRLKGELTTAVGPDNPLRHTTGATLDSLYLEMLITSVQGNCVHLTVTLDQPSVTFSRTFVLNCNGVGGGNAKLTEQNGSKSPMVPSPLEVNGNCQQSLTSPTPETGALLRVDLTPIKNDILTALATTNVMRFTLSDSTVGTRVTFAMDADDSWPHLVMRGTFTTTDEHADYSLSYTHLDDSLAAIVSEKIDDRRHTANCYDLSLSSAATKRFAGSEHYFGADYRLKRSLAFMYPSAVAAQTDSVGYRYTGLGQMTTMIDQMLDSTVTRTDMRGRPLVVTNPDGTHTSYYHTFLADNRWYLIDSLRGTEDIATDYIDVTTRTDENGVKFTRYTDADNRLQMEVSDSGGLNLVTSYDYDLAGHLVRVVNPNWDTTFYTYDPFGRVRTKHHPDLGTVSYAYDKVGNVRFTQSQSQADSNQLLFTEYDDLNRPTLIGEARLVGGLSVNRLTNQLDPQRLHTGTYSSILTSNRTLWLSNATPSPVFWQPLPPMTMVPPGCSLQPDTFLLGETYPPVEPLLYHTCEIFNPPPPTSADSNNFENLAEHPEFVRIAVSYDEMPDTVGTVWGAFPMRAFWDSLSPKKSVRNGLGREVATAWREHAGEPFYYSVLSYDERGRVEALMRYTDNLGFDAVYYRYNSADQVIVVRVADPMRQYTTWYGYDANGLIDSVWTLLQPFNTGLGFGMGKFPTEPTRPASADIVYRYNKRGQVAKMNYLPISTQVDYEYNHRSWLDSMMAVASPTGGPTILFKELLTYDSTGLILRQNWQRGNSVTEKQQIFGYDAVRRLVGWSPGGGDSTIYRYDRVGNRDTAGRIGAMPYFSKYTYDRTKSPDQLRSVSNYGIGAMITSYDYDANGVVTSRRDSNIMNQRIDAAQGFTQNWRGQTRQFTSRDFLNGTTTEWRYRYNAMGERDQKRLYELQAAPHGVGTDYGWVYYLLGGNNEQLAVYHGREIRQGICNFPGSGVVIYPVEYNTYSGGECNLTTRPDSVLPSGRKEYLIADHLGSTRVVLNGSGNPTVYNDYQPFGKASNTEPRLSYVQKEMDKESVLGNFGVRPYDSEIGRFTAIDPLWEEYRNISPYLYCDNDPIEYKDPEGKCVSCGPAGKLAKSDETGSGNGITDTWEGGRGTTGNSVTLGTWTGGGGSFGGGGSTGTWSDASSNKSASLTAVSRVNLIQSTNSKYKAKIPTSGVKQQWEKTSSSSRNTFTESPEYKRNLGDLRPIHSLESNAITAIRLKLMRDDELLKTVTDPLNRDYVVVGRDLRVWQGNTRIIEMQRRMTSGNTIFSPSLRIPVHIDNTRPSP